MNSDQQRADVPGAQQSVTLDAATPPHCPAPMPRQVIVFWTPRSLLAGALQTVKIVASKALRYQVRAYQRVTINVPNHNDRR